MSRCEEVLRVGDSRCPDMCRVHPDGLKKPRQKKTNVDASAASKTTELSSSAPQAQQTQTLKPQATEKKPPETATASSAQASKEK